MKFNRITYTVIIFVFLGSACNLSRKTDQTEPKLKSPINANEPTLEINVGRILDLRKPLALQWKITNYDAMPIYLFSTLLQKTGNEYAEIILDSDHRIITICFTRLSSIALVPNYFPKPGFSKIESGKSQEGSYESTQSVGEMFRANNVKWLNNMSEGWSVRSLIAYGYEAETVEETVDQSIARGIVHPINPVVEWQKIVYSNSVNVILKE
jgi:hypothetical protein